MVQIGDNIKKYREMLKYSQQYVAEELGISQNAYSKIENNQTRSFTLERLEKIAALFNIALVDLLGVEKTVSIQNSDLNNSGGYNVNHYDSPVLIETFQKQIADLQAERDRLLAIIDKMASYI